MGMIIELEISTVPILIVLPLDQPRVVKQVFIIVAGQTRPVSFSTEASFKHLSLSSRKLSS